MNIPFINRRRNHSKTHSRTPSKAVRILAKGQNDALQVAPHIRRAWLDRGKRQLEAHISRLPSSELPSDPVRRGDYLNSLHLKTLDIYLAYVTGLVMQPAVRKYSRLAEAMSNEEMREKAAGMKEVMAEQRRFLVDHGIDVGELEAQFLAPRA